MKLTTSIQQVPQTSTNTMHNTYRILIEGYGSYEECEVMAKNLHKVFEGAKPIHKGGWKELKSALDSYCQGRIA